VSSSSTETTLVDVTMPQMGVSVAEGTVVEWKKQPGDWVQADEIIASISTDKIDTDVEAPATGRVQEVLVEVGTTVDVGTVLARIATDAKPGEAHMSESEAPRPEPAEPAERSAPRRYSPVVQRIAAEHGIDLEQVEGTGRGGRVRKQDVLAFLDTQRTSSAGTGNGDGAPAVEEPPMHIESPYRPDEPAPPKTRKPRFEAPPAAPEPAPAGSAPLSRMRQAIGSRMLESLQTAATCTTIVEADLVRIEAARKETGFTYLPYIARATIETLRQFPALNATLEDDVVTTYDGVHLGIAVSLGEGGLIVPIIRDAQDLSVEGLAGRIKDLAKRARTNQLTPDEVRGGSFTITNPGGYGSIIATPVINQPQVAILDTEAVVKRPVVITDELGNDSIAIRPMTYVCMSWDHRALDGALAAQFLNELRKKLESWPTTQAKV
jgi:pyruvate/2-oxoglutarate dehydrogenase complex dihydrolipoamide acyltransferase (E2) component